MIWEFGGFKPNCFRVMVPTKNPAGVIARGFAHVDGEGSIRLPGCLKLYMPARFWSGPSCTSVGSRSYRFYKVFG
jgi:hypothetical protein